MKIRTLKYIFLFLLIPAAVLTPDTNAAAGDLLSEGEAFYKSYRYEEAIESYKRALEILEREKTDSNKPAIDVHLKLGQLYILSYRYDEAMEHSLKALEAYETLKCKSGIAKAYNHLGVLYRNMARNDLALRYHEDALSIHESLADKTEIAKSLYYLGSIYFTWSDANRALPYYERSLAISQEIRDRDMTALNYQQISMSNYILGNFDKTLEDLHKALEINRELGNSSRIAGNLTGMGLVYDSKGDFDLAVEQYRKALEINERTGDKANAAVILGNIGVVYQSWGQYDRAVEYYQRALKVAEEIEKKDSIALHLTNLAGIYSNRLQYGEAIEYYEKALYLHEELGNHRNEIVSLNGLGTLYYEKGQYDMALYYFGRAEYTAEENGIREYLADSLLRTGWVYRIWGFDDLAIDYFRQALEIQKEMQAKPGMANSYHTIGEFYFFKEEYGKAEEFLNRSIALKEDLRLTAEGELRRDYIHSQIATYQILLRTHVKNNDPVEAFMTAELSSAKYLTEQLGGKMNGQAAPFEGILSYRRRIPEEELVIKYGNIDWDDLTILTADRENIDAFEVNKKIFVEENLSRWSELISHTVRDLRSISVKEKDRDDMKVNAEQADFERIVHTYRRLLSSPDTTGTQNRAREDLAREFYRLLIAPVEPYLHDKTSLKILPDGILAFLPFETFIMPDGKYLIEKYHITYTPSLTASGIISERKYPEERKTLLAFGGAAYNESAYTTEMEITGKFLRDVRKKSREAINRSQSTSRLYAQLGISQWSNLPGTLEEVKAIKNIFPNSIIYTGEKASESAVKRLSAKNELKDFDVIHFATHGVVVPEVPELSAIVLSLNPQTRDGEDGYLTMAEIAELNLQARFVNLSACDTGLGKIYGGEGVVGLMQSFLIAGANGVSVSLWQVADRSTMELMTGLYSIVKEKGLTYARALTEMKRTFIKNADYHDPFFWAPFVHYGN
jgi:CHAT domain-containing protein/tetratricopeptide (TPR) repeat protein